MYKGKRDKPQVQRTERPNVPPPACVWGVLLVMCRVAWAGAGERRTAGRGWVGCFDIVLVSENIASHTIMSILYISTCDFGAPSGCTSVGASRWTRTSENEDLADALRIQPQRNKAQIRRLYKYLLRPISMLYTILAGVEITSDNRW